MPTLTRRDVILLVFIAALAVVTRFPTLGLQSPWLDEINNWQIALENDGSGLAERTEHQLTYFFQRVGLRVSDSVFGLRLYAALFSTFAIILSTLWMLLRAGRTHAFICGFILSFSPFGIFYGQDANHYGPLLLLGIISALGTDVVLERRGPSWKSIITFPFLLGFLALFAGFHPMGLFSLAGALVAGLIWFFVHAQDLPPRRIQARTKRIVLALALLVAGALAAPEVIDRLILLGGEAPPHARRFTLQPESFTAVLAAFYAGIHHFALLDRVIGTTGLLLSVLGFLLAWRRPELRWGIVGCAAVAVLVILPFFFLSFRRYFHPRYFTCAVFPLLMGVAFAVAELYTRRSALRHFAGGWIIVFAFVSVAWQANRLSGSFHPTREAMEWIRRNTEEDAIFLIRHHYTSLAFPFLWERENMNSTARELRPLSWLFFAGEVSIQQAEAVLWTEDRPVYLIADHEDHRSEVFSRWLEGHELAVKLESNIPDAFMPIDWGIPIYRLNRPAASPFTLPRDPLRADSLLAERSLGLWSHGDGLVLPPGSGASYKFALEESGEGLQLKIKSAGKGDDRFLVLSIDEAIFAAQVPGGSGDVTISLSHPMEVGMREFKLVHGMKHDYDTKSTVKILAIEPLGNSVDAIRARAVNPSCHLDIGGERSGGPGRGTEMIAQFDSVPPAIADCGEWIVFTRTIWPRGLGDNAVATRVSLSGGAGYFLHYPASWTYAPMLTGNVIPAEELQKPFKIRHSVQGFFSFRPRTWEYDAGPITIHAAGNQDDE